VIDGLLAQLPTARATWVLILTGLTGIAFSLSAFACDRLGHTIISPFLRRTVVRCIRCSGLVLAIGSAWSRRTHSKGKAPESDGAFRFGGVL